MGRSKGGGGGSSWLNAVKKAFRSPSKDTNSAAQNNKKNSRKSRDDNNDQEQDEDEKKREKRRWLFRKHSSSSSNNGASLKNDQSNKKSSSTAPPPLPPNKTAAAESVDHRHAIAVAAATAAAAEAAVATAQAAVEIIRLTRPSSASNPPKSIKQQQHYAAITIQKAFRGYLARRALVALRGIVKLQAVIRGQNVRRQAQMTLRCMQALLRLQTRMHHHPPHHEKRLSQDGDGNGLGRSRKSMFAESNTNSFFWDSQSVPERKSMSTRDRRGSVSSMDWNWNWNEDCPITLEELEERLQSRKEAAAAAALQRETTSSSSSSLAYAFSQKIWNNPEDNDDTEVGDQRTKWLEQWMETKQLSNSRRFSTDHKRDCFVKTVEMDTNHNHNAMMTTPKRYSASLASSSPANNNVRKMRQQSPAPSACPSPGRGLKTGVQAPSTPSPLSKAKPAATTPLRTPSPRSYSAANTPSLRSMQRVNAASAGPRLSSAGTNGYVPNYMAATASAKARVRSQSAPRQRPSTPERDHRSGAGSGSTAFAKKRLSFPVPPTPIREGCEAYSNSDRMNCYSQNLRSPSFKSMQAGYVGMEQQSCYTESINGGEISPCSTTELRWWLR